MRTSLTPSLVLVLVSAMNAQAPGDTLTLSFEDPGSSLQLDSLYPAGCWQIGPPAKPVFTSAYTDPNVLITDTVQPHTASSTCYAQFSTTIDDDSWYGKWLAFRHRMDMDSLQSFGWVEYRPAFSAVWSRAGDWNTSFLFLTEFVGDGLTSDSGVVFTGSNAEWTEVAMSLDCMTLVTNEGSDRGGDPTGFVFRFVFQGDENLQARDGWMIDDVRLASRICLGGMDEPVAEDLALYPIPASDAVTLTWNKGRGGSSFEVFDARGVLVRRGNFLAGANRELDVRELPPGAYAVRVHDRQGSSTARFFVER